MFKCFYALGAEFAEANKLDDLSEMDIHDEINSNVLVTPTQKKTVLRKANTDYYTVTKPSIRDENFIQNRGPKRSHNDRGRVLSHLEQKDINALFKRTLKLSEVKQHIKSLSRETVERLDECNLLHENRKRNKRESKKESNYICKICELKFNVTDPHLLRFRTKNDLKRHTQKHFKLSTHICVFEGCDFKGRSDNVQTHVKDEHKISGGKEEVNSYMKDVQESWVLKFHGGVAEPVLNLE
jgi:hypothetical protein